MVEFDAQHEVGAHCMERRTVDQPLVSVAIISFNFKDYLAESIEAVRCQTYGPIELVVGDDASTDGSQDYLKSLQTDTRFRSVRLVLHEKNVGVTSNCNSVLRECTGKYIAWVGGDDICLPEKIERQVQVMEFDLSIGLCFHNLEMFESPSGKHTGFLNGPRTPRTGTWLDLALEGTINGGTSTMTRNLFGSIEYSSRYPVASDWMFWIENLKNNNLRFHYIDEVLGRYRRHANSVSASRNRHFRQAMVDHFLTVGDLWISTDVSSRDLRKRVAELVFSLRKYEGSFAGYLSAVGVSFFLHPRIKAFVGCAGVILSFGFLRL